MKNAIKEIRNTNGEVLKNRGDIIAEAERFFKDFLTMKL